MFQDRWYQIEAADVLFERITANRDCHPIAAIPTGAGKTIALCRLVDKILSHNPMENVLVLSHVKEILEQDYNSLRLYFEWDEADGEFLDSTNIGVYSAGLDSKEIRKITVAGIQSAWNSPELFGRFTKVIVDECHLINTEDDGMYRKFLAALDANYVGFTATPFRTGHGYLHEGDNPLFNDLAYDLTSMENFNRLVDEGYLCRLYSKKTRLEFDTKGLRTVAGDFSQKDSSSRFDRKEITEAAISEVMALGADYKKWLFFAIDINHAENVVKCLQERGVSAVAVHSKMELDRDRVLKDAKAGKYRAIVSVDVLTTGYDDPGIDLIVLLRPTKSPIVYVQSVGRGLRVVYAGGYDLATIDGRLNAQASGPKPHCLVLDFAGNARRLGPINDVLVKRKGDKGGGGPMVKNCPECGVENHLSAKKCCFCLAEFPREEKIETTADAEADIVRTEKPEKKDVYAPNWWEVKEITYFVMPGFSDMPPRFRVDYVCEGNKKFTDLISLEGHGYGLHRALHWVNVHWDRSVHGPIPTKVNDLYYYAGNLRVPYRIYAKKQKKNGQIYSQFLEYDFEGDY